MHHLGEIAGIVSLCAYLKYIVSVLQGTTKPSRSTWWILTFVGVIVFISSYSIGIRESLWIQAAYIIGPLIIATLSLVPKYGYGSKLLGIDIVCLFGGIICIALWIVFDSPVVAFAGAIIVDFIGLIPTFKKAYSDPGEEDPTAWTIEVLASCINLLAVQSWFTLVNKDWIYASYLFVVNVVMVVLLLRFKKVN